MNHLKAAEVLERYLAAHSSELLLSTRTALKMAVLSLRTGHATLAHEPGYDIVICGSCGMPVEEPHHFSQCVEALAESENSAWGLVGKHEKELDRLRRHLVDRVVSGNLREAVHITSATAANDIPVGTVVALRPTPKGPRDTGDGADVPGPTGGSAWVQLDGPWTRHPEWRGPSAPTWPLAVMVASFLVTVALAWMCAP